MTGRVWYGDRTRPVFGDELSDRTRPIDTPDTSGVNQQTQCSTVQLIERVWSSVGDYCTRPDAEAQRPVSF